MMSTTMRFTAHTTARRTHRVAKHAPRRASRVHTRAKDPKDIDWQAKTKEFTSERVLASCLEAVIAGDEAALDACLFEVDNETDSTDVSTEVVNTLRGMDAVTKDAFWEKKLRELSAERVFEDCMTAVMRGDLDEVEACILDAENDELLK